MNNEQRGNASDIKIGLGRILACTGMNRHGKVVWGWVLPGGVFTADRDDAMRAAAIIDRTLQAAINSGQD